MEFTTLQAGIFEMGRLAAQVGESLDAFFPPGWGLPSRVVFARLKLNWFSTFYPSAAKPA
jgi:hypothetical protein